MQKQEITKNKSLEKFQKILFLQFFPLFISPKRVSVNYIAQGQGRSQDSNPLILRRKVSIFHIPLGKGFDLSRKNL